MDVGFVLLAAVGVLSSVAAECPADKVALRGGLCMPYASDGDAMKHTPSINDTVAAARWLAAGGRGLDSAWSYDHGGYGHSQRQMGVAIQASKLRRDEIWMTTKIPCGASVSAVLALVQYDLDQLMLDKVDLLLIHTPHPPACNSSSEIATTWVGMEAALKANMTAAIGVSNFNAAQLEALAAAPAVTEVPSVNQILLHVGQVDVDTIAYCTKAHIVTEAYSPMGHPNGGGKAVYDLPAVLKIAAAHNVTGAQVALRWLVQSGHPFVTASGLTAYDVEDLQIYNWSLTQSEMKTLDAVDVE